MKLRYVIIPIGIVLFIWWTIVVIKDLIDNYKMSKENISYEMKNRTGAYITIFIVVPLFIGILIGIVEFFNFIKHNW